MALAKTGETTLYAINSIASNGNDRGTALDVSADYEGAVRILVGRSTGTAWTVPPIIRLEASFATSPDETQWALIDKFSPALGNAIGSTTVSGTASAGATTFVLTSNTNFASGNLLFLKNGTLANSEWRRGSLATSTYTTDAPLVFPQTGSSVLNQAEEFPLYILSLLGINKLRISVDNFGTGQAIIVKATIGAPTGI